MFSNETQAGFTVVEVLVGLTLFVTIFLFIFETLTLYFANQNRILEYTKALYLAEAGQEFVRYLRDDDWASFSGLTTGTAHYLDIGVGTSTVAVSATPEVIDGSFTRRFTLWPAYRNGDDDLVASTTPGATADPDSFIVNMVVTWGTAEQVMLQAFLGNIQNQ